MIEGGKLTIKRLNEGEEQLAQAAALSLIPEVERNGEVPSLAHLQKLLALPSNYLILALLDEKPIGFTIAYSMPRYDRDGQMAYIYEIAVSSEYRRQGIGSRMIKTLKECMLDNGVTTIWVGTEAENKPAASLYEATGAKRDSSLIHEFWYKDLNEES